MLKLTLKPGEFIDIGENIRIVFSGGSANNIHLLIDAPRELNIARSNTAEKKQQNKKKRDTYYTDPSISKEAQREIVKILKKEREQSRMEADMQKEYEAQHTDKAYTGKAPRKALQPR